MASLGLLGAIGGVGKALENIGSDIVKRRERALEWLREESKYQRQVADQNARDDKNFGQQKQLQDERLTSQAEQNRIEREARQAEKAEDRQIKRLETEDERAYKDRVRAEELRGRKEMARLEAGLSRSNTEAGIRLRKKLGVGVNEGFKSVMYGPPDEKGMAEVILLKPDGTMQHTGSKVYRPATTSQITGDDEDDF